MALVLVIVLQYLEFGVTSAVIWSCTRVTRLAAVIINVLVLRHPLI